VKGHSILKICAQAVAGAAIVGGIAPSASAITYDRNSAVAYGNANWNKVVTDGLFWINSGTESSYAAGSAVPVNATNEADGIGDDCAHFVSSCIGSPGVTAGGLTIPSRGVVAGSYGEPGAARLDELLVGNSGGGYGTKYEYGTLVSSVSQLTPGDVIGYDWDGSGDGSMSGIDHTVLYIGNNEVDCHATSHKGANWTLGGADDYFFIHITLADSIVPTAPTNSLPSANSSVSSSTVTFKSSTFSDGAIGSSQVAAEWAVYRNGSPIYDSGTDNTHLSSLTLPAGSLIAGSSYTWKVRYQDNYGDWSSYSSATAFTTLAVPEPTSVAVLLGAGMLSMRRKRR
jgi:hypothetical protein